MFESATRRKRSLGHVLLIALGVFALAGFMEQLLGGAAERGRDIGERANARTPPAVARK